MTMSTYVTEITGKFDWLIEYCAGGGFILYYICNSQMSGSLFNVREIAWSK